MPEGVQIAALQEIVNDVGGGDSLPEKKPQHGQGMGVQPIPSLLVTAFSRRYPCRYVVQTILLTPHKMTELSCLLQNFEINYARRRLLDGGFLGRFFGGHGGGVDPIGGIAVEFLRLSKSRVAAAGEGFFGDDNDGARR